METIWITHGNTPQRVVRTCCSPRFSILRTHQRCAGHSFDHCVKHLLGQAQQCGATVHDGLVRIILQWGRDGGEGTWVTWHFISTHGSSLLSLCICYIQIWTAPVPRWWLQFISHSRNLGTKDLLAQHPHFTDKEAEARKGSGMTKTNCPPKAELFSYFEVPKLSHQGTPKGKERRPICL